MWTDCGVGDGSVVNVRIKMNVNAKRKKKMRERESIHNMYTGTSFSYFASWQPLGIVATKTPALNNAMKRFFLRRWILVPLVGISVVSN